MPYGVDKSIGGDNKENDSFMERCVNGITGKNKRTGEPYTKGEKIAICKSALKRKHEGKSEYINNFVVDEYFLNTQSQLMQRGITSNISQANEMSLSILESNDWDIDKSTKYLIDLISH